METIPFFLPHTVACTILSFAVDLNQKIKKNDPICTYFLLTDPASPRTFTAPIEGKITSLFPIDELIPNAELTPVAHIEKCAHHVVWHSVCAECGEEILEDVSAAALRKEKEHAPVHYGSRQHTLHLSTKAISSQIELNMRRLFEKRKLLLVLDIDHTLLHTSDDSKCELLLRGPSDGDDDERSSFLREDVMTFELDRPLFTPRQVLMMKQRHYVKLRPFLRQFLRRVTKLFEIHIYTMGTRDYANAAINLINSLNIENLHLTTSDVISRSECSDLSIKELRRVLPCDPNATLIVDDRVDVWATSTPLISAFEYKFWNAHEVYDRTQKHNLNESEIKKHNTSSVSAVNANGEVILEEIDDDDSVGPPVLSDDQIQEGQKDPETPRNKRVAFSDTVTVHHHTVASDSERQSKRVKLNDGSSGPKTLAMMPPVLPHQFIKGNEDNVLLSLASVLEATHRLFYSQFSEDPALPLANGKGTANLLSAIKSTVFSDCHFVFSGVFPTNMSLEVMQKSMLYSGAISGGARIHDNINEKNENLLTHVVAAADNSAKIRKAHEVNIKRKEMGLNLIHIVHISWLHHSLVHFKRVSEDLFQLHAIEAEIAASNVYIAENNKRDVRSAIAAHLQHTRQIVTSDEIFNSVNHLNSNNISKSISSQNGSISSPISKPRCDSESLMNDEPRLRRPKRKQKSSMDMQSTESKFVRMTTIQTNSIELNSNMPSTDSSTSQNNENDALSDNFNFDADAEFEALLQREFQ